MDTYFYIVILLVKFVGAENSKVNLNPEIPSTPDDAFIEFQKAVEAKQKELKTPVVFNNLEDYKSAFDSFKSGGGKLNIAQSASANADPNFAKFQKFMVNNMRQYNNFDEFKTRLGLFLNVAKKMAGYNYGGDGLSGINSLADKTRMMSL